MVKWQFAKTMPKIPHEYTVKSWKPHLSISFEHFVEHIRKNGYKEKFMKKEYTYFDFNGWKYWTMGDPIEETTIINRARIVKWLPR